MLAGLGGFKSPPDTQGMVEIGYSIYKNFQRKGLATEAARGLINHAFAQPGVTLGQAHTLAQENTSVRLLKTLRLRLLRSIRRPGKWRHLAMADDAGEV